MALNFTTYYTLSDMKAMRDLATSKSSYKTVINDTLVAKAVAGIGFLVKKSSYSLTAAASLKLLEFTSSVHEVDRTKAKGLYDDCARIMEGSNFNTVRFQLVAESSEGIYLANGLPKVTGYRRSDGSWLTIS